MPAESGDKLCGGVRMVLGAALFKAVDCRQRANLAAQLPIKAEGISRQKTAAECITDACWVNDLIFRYRRDMNRIAVGIQIRAIFAACDHQHFHMFEDLVETPAGFLRDQPKFVIVAKQEVRTLHVTGQLTAFESQHLLAGVIQIINSQLAAFGREFHHRIRRTRRNDHKVWFLFQFLD